MNLKLIDADKARVFGIDPQDMTAEEALNELARDHPRWTVAEIENHLDEAVAAGAFSREEIDT